MACCIEVAFCLAAVMAGALCWNSTAGNLNETHTANVSDFYNEEDFQIVSKRSSSAISLSWSCEQKTEWRILGESYFPSRIRETVCLSSTCLNFHYNCTRVQYSMLILTRCGAPPCSDDRVPAALRSFWEFINLRVTVGCVCAR